MKRLTIVDVIAATSLLMGAILLRVPFRSSVAYHWDDAQFALAITDYNVALSQPHAPGYFLYVMLGRMITAVTGEPYASLVGLNLVLSSGVVALVYVLGALMFDRRSAVAAGLFALTSPLLWFHGCVGLNYATDAFLVCLIIGCSWRALQRGGRWADAAILGMLLGLAAGIRQQSAMLLAPLLAYVISQFDRDRLAKFALFAATAAAVGVLWFIPMIRLSGGLASYLGIIARYSDNNAAMTFAGNGVGAVIDNIFRSALFCINGLLLGAVALAVAIIYRFCKRRGGLPQLWKNRHGRAMTLLAWWIMPAVIFGTVIQFTLQPGHVLNYLPALLLISGVVVARVPRRGMFIFITLLIAAANAAMFLAWPARWDRVFNHQARTARELRHHERDLTTTLQAIRSHYHPGNAVVYHAIPAHFLFGFRHFQLHLPEFDQYQLGFDPTIAYPDDRTLWYGHEGKLQFSARPGRPDQGVILLIVPPGLALDIFEQYMPLDNAQPLADAPGTVYVVQPTGADR